MRHIFGQNWAGSQPTYTPRGAKTLPIRQCLFFCFLQVSEMFFVLPWVKVIWFFSVKVAAEATKFISVLGRHCHFQKTHAIPQQFQTLTCPQADSVSISDDRQMPLIFHEQKRSFFQIDFFPIDFNSHFLHQRYFETFWVFGTFVFIKSNSNCSGPTKCQRVSSIIGDSHWESWIATPIGATPICS